MAVMTFEPAGGKGFFAANSTAPREARRWVGAYFLAQGRGDLMDDAELLVSELVTNALLHAPPLFEHNGEKQICVRMVRFPKVYRVEVYDGDPSAPPEHPSFAGSKRIHGRGLPLVDDLATERGWLPYTDPQTGAKGKCVWFTFERKAKSV